MRDFPPVVAFDLDGTLVDTAPDLIAALNHVLTLRGRPTVPLETVRRVVGQGAAETIERGMRITGDPPAASERAELLALFLDYYGAHLTDFSRPFDGVIRCLSDFRARGYQLAVCTNKSEVLARRVLENLELEEYFTAILGGDTLAVRKPDPTHVIETVRRAGGDPAFAVMVGDSDADIKAAKSANIPVIGVTFGYSPVPIGELAPDHVIAHYRELPAHVDRIFGI
jgi:phosphoglycolate phosphatase